ncbi:MAG: PD-(D/E)XK motif protein [Myxococcaceae bacterium]
MSRHLSWEFLAARVATGTPSIESIKGTPACEVRVEAGGGRLSLIISVERTEDEQLPSFAAIECRRVGNHVQLSCTERDRYQDFYAFVMAVADRVQLQGQPLVEAINDAVESVRTLIAATNVLSEEQQLGLWAELETLRQVAQRTGWKTALDSWVANRSEEHDFALPHMDLEVKATSNELRRHHISSASQLTPKPERELFVLSWQMTTGGAGGRSLGEVVADARKSVDSAMSKRFEQSLREAGWLDRDAPRYPTRWLQRGGVFAIKSTELPRVELVGPAPHRVTNVSFVVDVSGLGQKVEGDWSWLIG